VRQYVIAGSYLEYVTWRREDLERARGVHLLTESDRFDELEPGVVHRAPGWERSPVLQEALELEAGRPSA